MDARTLANTRIDDLTFTIIDTETTGMNAEFNRVMDIGIVQVKNGKVVEEWEALINPKQPIPYWITFYTKLVDSEVKNQPTFDHFFEKIKDMLHQSIFVGHNASFDYSFLASEFKRCEFELKNPKLCTVMLGRKLLPQLSNAHLDALSDYYNIKISQRHRALPDAKATAYVLLEFIKIAKDKYKAKNFFDLERLQRISVEKSIENDQLLKLI